MNFLLLKFLKPNFFFKTNILHTRLFRPFRLGRTGSPAAQGADTPAHQQPPEDPDPGERPLLPVPGGGGGGPLPGAGGHRGPGLQAAPHPGGHHQVRVREASGIGIEGGQ